MTDYTRNIEDVDQEEAQNWPKGSGLSTHTFMEGEMSPVVDRRYYNNEEIAFLYQVRRNVLMNEGMSRKEAELQAKIEVLPIIYPEVDIVNFRENNPDMTSKCCRLIFSLPLDRIATYHIVHGEGLKFFNNSQKGDVDLGIPDDPLFGWDLTKPEEGFPCINLHEEDGGCHYHESGNKPDRCKRHPVKESDVQFITTCSYNFDENGVRTGTCDSCMG
jgi:hypothetical protein